MKNFKHILFTFAIVLAALSMQAQSIVDLRLNEILLKNEENFTDEYSRQVPWVEIFNSAYNSVDVGGCYLTNDTTGLAAAQKDKAALSAFKEKCYNIPKGDPKTLMNQRSSVVFFMDGDPTYGTFHVNFKPDQTNYVALIGSDGKTLIDMLVFPAYLRNKCVSFGCEEDGIVADGRANTVIKKNVLDPSVKDLRKELTYFTPGSNNKVIASESKADKLAKNDPHGIAMTIMAMFIVFTVLFIIFLVLKIFARVARNQQAKKDAAVAPAAAPAVKGGEPTPEELAAITMALHESMGGADEDEIAAVALALYLHLYTNHDYESEVITFGDDADYSVWGQKHFNFKRNPNRK